MELSERIIRAVAPHPAVRSIKLVGSRAEGRAHEHSDWDFLVEANDFAGVARALPRFLAPLDPLVQQWDRLSPEWCWMMILRGPAKVDLIFPDQPHTNEPPWTPSPKNLAGIDAHFWDWMLWLRSKEASSKAELIAGELEKLYDHLLAPLGVEHRPPTLPDALDLYRAARDHAEQCFGTKVDRELETAVASSFSDLR
jgi:hypothetical protein